MDEDKAERVAEALEWHDLRSGVFFVRNRETDEKLQIPTFERIGALLDERDAANKLVAGAAKCLDERMEAINNLAKELFDTQNERDALRAELAAAKAEVDAISVVCQFCNGKGEMPCCDHEWPAYCSVCNRGGENGVESANGQFILNKEAIGIVLSEREKFLAESERLDAEVERLRPLAEKMEMMMRPSQDVSEFYKGEEEQP